MILVNRCFDTIVDDVIVEKGSVHGQFVNYVKDNLWTLEELDEKWRSPYITMKVKS